MRLIDLTEQKFGKLTVIKRGENTKNGRVQWLCQCDCGNPELVLVRADCLKNGNTQSCGCFHKEMAYSANKQSNLYDLSGEFGVGYTAKGERFYFDLEDYEKIKDIYWHINDSGYVINITDKTNHFRMVLTTSCPSNFACDFKANFVSKINGSRFRFVVNVS